MHVIFLLGETKTSLRSGRKNADYAVLLVLLSVTMNDILMMIIRFVGYVKFSGVYRIK